MIKLRLDTFIKRAPDRSARYEAGRPLTEKQKKILAEKCLDKCVRAYITRMRASALVSDTEEVDDLKSEAYIAMWNIINKFDLAKCGPLSKYDVPGVKNPKTLEFYFINYFYGRVNFIAAEARAFKKQRGIGPVEMSGDVEYNPEASDGKFSEYESEYDITGHILSELKKEKLIMQRFFYQFYVLQLTQRELRSEYGDEFDNLKNLLEKFVADIKKRFPNKGF